MSTLCALVYIFCRVGKSIITTLLSYAFNFLFCRTRKPISRTVSGRTMLYLGANRNLIRRLPQNREDVKTAQRIGTGS